VAAQITMNKKNELTRNTVILTIGKLCTQFISFLLLPLYTSLLSPQEYGSVDLFNTYCMLLLPVFNWQLDSGMFRFLLDCRDDKDRQKLIFTTILNTCFIQTALYLLFFAFAYNYMTSGYRIYLALDVILNIFLCSLLQFARGIGKITHYTVASFISAVSMVGINVLLIAVFHFGAEGMYFATVAAKLITILYLAYALRTREYYMWWCFDQNLFKEIAKYSLPLIPNQFSWWVIGVSDRVIISALLGMPANGIYSVANKFSGLFITFYNIFNLSWTESASLHLHDEDEEQFLTEMVNTIFFFFASGCFGLIAIMPFIFPFMINSQYQDAYKQIPILMIAVLFQVLVGLYSAVYVASRKTKEIAKTSFWAAVVNILFNILLIKKLGLYAASLSTLAAYLTMGIYRYFHVKQYVNMPIRKRSALGAIMAGSVSIISYYWGNRIVKITSLIVICIYLILANRKTGRYVFRLVRKKLKK
jgi:O-antigen/teichoic acid export membrane protein